MASCQCKHIGESTPANGVRKPQSVVQVDHHTLNAGLSASRRARAIRRCASWIGILSNHVSIGDAAGEEALPQSLGERIQGHRGKQALNILSIGNTNFVLSLVCVVNISELSPPSMEMCNQPVDQPQVCSGIMRCSTSTNPASLIKFASRSGTRRSFKPSMLSRYLELHCCKA